MILLHVALDLVQVTLQLLQSAIIYIGHLLKILDSILRLLVVQTVLLGTRLATLRSIWRCNDRIGKFKVGLGNLSVQLTRSKRACSSESIGSWS